MFIYSLMHLNQLIELCFSKSVRCSESVEMTELLTLGFGRLSSRRFCRKYLQRPNRINLRTKLSC